ncbi:MAG TPA: hypothetical protein VGZ00_05845 [Candidatus Baltobacteraceae bacterium]|jgi:hypothetical protein|nr:hypothetical protein [Candidatus Baltobacteraceae bacterium]
MSLVFEGVSVYDASRVAMSVKPSPKKSSLERLTRTLSKPITNVAEFAREYTMDFMPTRYLYLRVDYREREAKFVDAERTRLSNATAFLDQEFRDPIKKEDIAKLITERSQSIHELSAEFKALSQELCEQRDAIQRILFAEAKKRARTKFRNDFLRMKRYGIKERDLGGLKDSTYKNEESDMQTFISSSSFLSKSLREWEAAGYVKDDRIRSQLIVQEINDQKEFCQMLAAIHGSYKMREKRYLLRLKEQTIHHAVLVTKIANEDMRVNLREDFEGLKMDQRERLREEMTRVVTEHGATSSGNERRPACQDQRAQNI